MHLLLALVLTASAPLALAPEPVEGSLWSPAELPRVYLDTHYVPAPGMTIQRVIVASASDPA